MIATIVEAVLKLLTALFVAAPTVAQAITGGRSYEETAAATRAAIEALPKREAAGGDDTAGAWDRDLAKRKARGEG